MADYEWQGVVKTAMPEYIRKEEDATVRRRIVLKAMQRQGRVTRNHTGPKCVSVVTKTEPPIEGYVDGGQLDFAPGDYYVQAELDWRGYKGTEFLSEKQKAMTRSSVMLVKHFQDKIPLLFKGLRRQLGTDIYVDGNATGYTDGIHGAKSWSGYTTPPANADTVAVPDDSFANIATDLAQYDTWTSDLSTYPNAVLGKDWPEGGEGNTSGYDFYSPKLVKWNSESWPGGLTTFTANGQYVLSKTQQWLELSADVDGADLFVLLAPNLFTDFKNSMRSRGRTLHPHPEGRDLGFPNVLEFDGMKIQSEFGITPNQGWMFNVRKMELCSMNSRLFTSEGPNWSDDTPGWKFQAGFLGNMKWGSPKFHAFIGQLA